MCAAAGSARPAIWIIRSTRWLRMRLQSWPQRGLSKPFVMGHSMGARTAIRAARKNPAPFSGLILLDPPVSGPGRRAYPPGWAWYGDSIRASQKGCSAPDMRVFCPTWTDEQVALRAEWLHTCQYTAIKTAYDGFHTDDIHADLPQITLPMRLVVAGGAPVIQAEDITEIQGLAPAYRAAHRRRCRPHDPMG